jgi:TolB protein
VFQGDRDNHPNLYVLGLHGSDCKQLTDDSGSDFGPAWSPDGSRIAFARNLHRDREASDIYVVNADGSGARRLTDEPLVADTAPTWSADSGQVAFERHRNIDRANYSTDIYVIDVDGDNIRRLTTGRSPAFSPGP